MSERFERYRPGLPLAVSGILLMGLPVLAANDYQVTLFTEFCITLLLLSGLNLISGHGGQFSLGQATFYGIGAYFAAIGSLKLGMPSTLAFVLAPVVAAVLAVFVGLPSLRLRGMYFAMATLGVAVVFVRLLNHAVALTGGPNGLGGMKPLALGGLTLDSPLSLYYLSAILAWAGLVIAQLYLRSRMGWSLRAAKASEPATAVVGIDTFRIRLGAFALSGLYAGLAGSLETFHTGYITPPTFTYFASVILVVVLTLGGMGTYLGPIIGAFILYAFSRWLPDFSDAEPLILGTIFLISLRLFPQGIAASIADLIRRLSTRSRPAQVDLGEQ